MPKNPESFGDCLKVEKPEHLLGFLLKSLHHTLRQTFDEALRRQGVELSFAQFSALFNLHCDPGVTGARLARRALVSAQTMNLALHGLERDGYIERRPHPSTRRADSWSLTSEGLSELERAREVGSAIFTRMLATFDASEVAAFEDYLRRCITALGGESALGAAELPRSDARDTAAPRRGPLARGHRRQNAGVNSTKNV
jgi:DNA-binding MarR family transcriptional regulator